MNRNAMNYEMKNRKDRTADRAIVLGYKNDLLSPPPPLMTHRCSELCDKIKFKFIILITYILKYSLKKCNKYKYLLLLILILI